MRKLSVTIWHNVKETPSAGAVALTEDVFFRYSANIQLYSKMYKRKLILLCKCTNSILHYTKRLTLHETYAII